MFYVIEQLGMKEKQKEAIIRDPKVRRETSRLRRGSESIQIWLDEKIFNVWPLDGDIM